MKKIDEKYFWKNCCLEAEQKAKEQSSLINQVQFDDDSLSVIVEELREENEKLKKELRDCITNNNSLEQEYNNLLRELKEGK